MPRDIDAACRVIAGKLTDFYRNENQIASMDIFTGLEHLSV